MTTIFSFLAPTCESRRSCSFDSEKLMHTLGMDLIFDCRNINWNELFTDDIETILYRQEVFRDLVRLPDLYELCRVAADQLESISELYRIRDNAGDNETNLYAIKEVELFIEFLDDLYERTKKLRGEIKSTAFLNFFDLIAATAQSETYLALCDGIKQLGFSVKSIKSITIGINLDETLSPYESGLLAINPEYFHSGDIVTRFMRMNLKRDEMATLAPLNPQRKLLSVEEQVGLSIVLNHALSKVVGSGFRSWKDMLHRYAMLNSKEYLPLLPELRFLTRATAVLMKIKDLHLPLCYPRVCPADERRFSAVGLYSPVTAWKLRDRGSDARLVPNDITFDEDGMLYVLTGPNHGGKSVALEAVGIAQCMFQMGLPVTAKEFTASPADAIFTHFPSGAGDTVTKGHFGEECARLQTLLSRVGDKSMILLDETLSGTDSYEASTIGKEVLAALAIIGCRGIFATHLHPLAMHAKEVNARDDIRSRVDNLVMSIENGNRTYKVIRRCPDGKSYAQDIANKYNLSLEKILKSNREKKQETEL